MKTASPNAVPQAPTTARTAAPTSAQTAAPTTAQTAAPTTASAAVRSVALAVLVTLAVVAAAASVVWADLGPPERAQLLAVLTPPRLALLATFTLVLLAVAAWLQWRWRRLALAPATAQAEAVDLILAGNPAHRAVPTGAPEARAAGHAINRLADRLAEVQAGASEMALAAKARTDAERKRLSALMGQLSQAVLVCNLEGTILLYNDAARRLLSGAGPGAGRGTGAAELVGLGRSVFGIIDRPLVAHALERIRAQLAAGEVEGAQCLASLPEVGLIRLRVAPVTGERGAAAATGAAAASGEAPAIEGFVLLLDDLTETLRSGSAEEALLRRLADATRGGLASIRAAAESLVDFPQMPAERQSRFTLAIRDEAVRLSNTLDEVWGEHARRSGAPWPLEEMRGEDLVRLAAARIRDRRGIPVLTDDVDPSVWLRCDSFGLTQGLSYLACRLVDELEVPELHLRVGTHERFARIDLLWRGKPMSSETAATWELDAFELGGETGNASLREVIDRHRGEVWFQRERASHSLYFRLLVPLAATRAAAQPAALASRPEFYDFDLFGAGSLPRELEERPLASLACTVFDTETTGLDPSGGDEIVSIAAVRIVNGRLLSDETFEQLVDPGRGMPPASISIHGITDEMVAGQPTIAEVLPRFHRFAQDTVLVAHNSAFDMRFLQLKEQATGVAFRQPVLDTLLLSQVAHPGQPDHGLEDIARRLGVDVVGRHTALGDALVTAEVFLRLLAALEARGIRTLGQAREASAKTYYAKVSY